MMLRCVPKREVLATLIESVTIYPEGPNGPEAEVVSKVADLAAFTLNDNAIPRRRAASSMAVVAGARNRLNLQSRHSTDSVWLEAVLKYATRMAIPPALFHTAA